MCSGVNDMNDLRGWSPLAKHSNVVPRIVVGTLIASAVIAAMGTRLWQEPASNKPNSVVADSELPSPTTPLNSH
jgi:hypothetical protein